MSRRNVQYRLFVPLSTTPQLLDDIFTLVDWAHPVPSPDWRALVRWLTLAYALDRDAYIQAVGERLHRLPELKSLHYTRRATALAQRLDDEKDGRTKTLLEQLMAVRAQVGAGIFRNAIFHPEAVEALTRSLSAWARREWDPAVHEYRDPVKARATFLGYAKALASEAHLEAIEGRLAA
jgi:hypothetical protein